MGLSFECFNLIVKKDVFLLDKLAKRCYTSIVNNKVYNIKKENKMAIQNKYYEDHDWNIYYNGQNIGEEFTEYTNTTGIRSISKKQNDVYPVATGKTLISFNSEANFNLHKDIFKTCKVINAGPYNSTTSGYSITVDYDEFHSMFKTIDVGVQAFR